MPTLSDKLKSLGVQIGAKDLRPREIAHKFPIEKVIAGSIRDTPFGEAFVVETIFPPDHRQGSIGLNFEASLNTIASWAKESRLKDCHPQDIYFLDTETSGLAGGAGTYAFLIGAGRLGETGFHLAQYFMRDPIEEPAQLAAFASFLGSCSGLVTFNGKTFDIPILNTRFITNSELSPLKSIAHLDLLPLARRLWRDRLPSRSLGYLEEHILGARRTQDDVPGWLIPGLYFNYLQDGDARPLKSIFYHNAMDILSLAALLNFIATLIEDPIITKFDHGMDIIAVAKLYEDLEKTDEAATLYAQSLDCSLPNQSRCEAIKRWSFLEKRRGNFEKALELWHQATSFAEIYAFIELAKYYEHRLGDYNRALNLTDNALKIIKTDIYPHLERWRWKTELEHRQARLYRKIGSISNP
jgi:uncharacterized protein